MTDHQQNVNLMKQMGSRAGYNPMPPDQHRWTMGKKRGPLYRFWGWMCDHTLSYGHRSPYAVDENGSERHIEHAAADLEMDLANTYCYWRKGINLGLWRNGTAEEGKRRMFLCGEVIPKVDEDDEDVRQPGNGLPPSIIAKVKEWSAETQREFWSTWAIRKTVRDTSLRELMAAAREILDRDDDEHLKTWGIQRNRQEHSPKNMPPEELQARQERIQKILPDLEKHVQTVQAFVQPQESAPYNGGYSGSAGAASLLNTEKDRERPEPPSDIDSKPVGRSVGRPSLETSDRPTIDSMTESLQPPAPPIAQLPYADPVRQWLETNVKIPGFPLEDPELLAIAATIHTDADLDQFKKAAARQSNPRGWRVYVKIAQQCVACRPAYAAAVEQGDPPGASPPIDFNSLILDLKKGKSNGR